MKYIILFEIKEENELKEKKRKHFFFYSSAIKNLEQTQGTWRQAPTATRHEAQLERLKAELKVKIKNDKCQGLFDIHKRKRKKKIFN
jgi:hypothetical protein